LQVMSLTSYRAAPPRGGRGLVKRFGLAAWRTWRRPTLPRLETQYHGLCEVSRPSSEWDRVGHTRAATRSAKQQGDVTNGLETDGMGCCPARRLALVAGVGRELDRAIRTGQLHALPRFHFQPIDVVVFHGSRARPGFEVGFPLRCFQRLS